MYRRLILGSVAVLIGTTAATAAISSPEAKTWRVVALGDSGASGKGDPSGLAWSGRYGRLLRQKRGFKVVVTNLARAGKSSTALLAELRFNSSTRAAVKNADIILFGSTAGASLNEGDANLEAGNCRGEACYDAALQSWARDFEQIVRTAVGLRRGKKTALRGVGEPNAVPGAEDVVPPFATVELGVYQARRIRETICATMKRHRGRCVDVLSAFNGPDGTNDAYKSGLMNKVECCYPSGKGQQLIAQLLFKTGLV